MLRSVLPAMSLSMSTSLGRRLRRTSVARDVNSSETIGDALALGPAEHSLEGAIGAWTVTEMEQKVQDDLDGDRTRGRPRRCSDHFTPGREQQMNQRRHQSSRKST